RRARPRWRHSRRAGGGSDGPCTTSRSPGGISSVDRAWGTTFSGVPVGSATMQASALAVPVSFASTLPESIGGEVAAANMDGPDADSGTCYFGRPLILTPAQRVNGTDAFAKPTHPSPSPVFQADSCI